MMAILKNHCASKNVAVISSKPTYSVSKNNKSLVSKEPEPENNELRPYEMKNPEQLLKMMDSPRFYVKSF